MDRATLMKTKGPTQAGVSEHLHGHEAMIRAMDTLKIPYKYEHNKVGVAPPENVGEAIPRA